LRGERARGIFLSLEEEEDIRLRGERARGIFLSLEEEEDIRLRGERARGIFLSLEEEAGCDAPGSMRVGGYWYRAFFLPNINVLV
jgi:hypothetical protein